MYIGCSPPGVRRSPARVLGPGVMAPVSPLPILPNVAFRSPSDIPAILLSYSAAFFNSAACSAGLARRTGPLLGAVRSPALILPEVYSTFLTSRSPRGPYSPCGIRDEEGGAFASTGPARVAVAGYGLPGRGFGPPNSLTPGLPCNSAGESGLPVTMRRVASEAPDGTGGKR